MIEEVGDGGAEGIEFVGAERERQAGVRRRQQDVVAGEELRDLPRDEVVVLLGRDEIGGREGLAGDVAPPFCKLRISGGTYLSLHRRRRGDSRMDRMYRSGETMHGIAMARHGGSVGIDGGMRGAISTAIEREFMRPACAVQHVHYAKTVPCVASWVHDGGAGGRNVQFVSSGRSSGDRPAQGRATVDDVALARGGLQISRGIGPEGTNNQIIETVAVDVSRRSHR
jgi:hypothetical protein